jgi:putative DNA methylase
MPEYRRKLIEVALPLEAINNASGHEKSIPRGHPSTLHLWWSRKPLATTRAVLFGQMVDDPESLPNEFPTEEMQAAERQRLFRIIEELVKWENTTNEAVLYSARVEIVRSAARNHGVTLPLSMTPDVVVNALKQYAPPVLDPFAGGGSIPLEAQRLGFEVYASDLNPVAVLINKALIEIPPKFAGWSPVNPNAHQSFMGSEWHRAQGLADDIRYYGKWMHDEVEKRIGHLYPKVVLSKEYGGGEATVIAWLWVRIVTCPNPACGVQMPLASKWWLSEKKGKKVWVEPLVDNTVVPSAIHFTVKIGNGKPKDGTVNRQGARCIACGTHVPFDYIRNEGKAGRMGTKLMAIVAEGQRGRVYLPPDEKQVTAIAEAKPKWKPDADLPHNPRDFKTPNYGMHTFSDLFTLRQLVALTTFSDLVQEARDKILTDASITGLPIDNISLDRGGKGANAYADAVATYLAEAVSKLTTFHNTLAYWRAKREQSATSFGRQAIPMVWDPVEINPFARAGGNFEEIVAKAVPTVIANALSACSVATVTQRDAATNIQTGKAPVISTDPPYYDNIGYADLSDFFYVWLRCSLQTVYPDLFKTMLVPKAQELVATPYRFGGSKSKAKEFFEAGLRKAFEHMRTVQHHDYPLTVYYAFKQAESEADKENEASSNGSTSKVIASTGWETMLEGLIRSGFTITGTWPMRTESTIALKNSSNNLASSIVLVCRPRAADAQLTTRRDFLSTLKRELPKALRNLQRGYIAPVDLAQAAIGPGMAVFSRYSKILESDGTPMRVRTALQLINQTLDEVLAEQEGEYDVDTRWAVAWFEQYGMEEGPFGVAETLSKAKNAAVGVLVESGILRAQGGKVRLLHRNELSAGWNSATARRLTAWEVTQRLIRELQEQGDAGAATILEHVGAYGEVARDLAYRLYTICERKKWPDEALAYNSLVVEWSGISDAVEQLRRTTAEQARLFS